MERVRMVSLVRSGGQTMRSYLESRGFEVLSAHAYPGAPGLEEVVSETELPLWIPLRDPVQCRISWANSPTPVETDDPISIEAVELLASLRFEQEAIALDVRRIQKVENSSEDASGLRAAYFAGEKVFPELQDQLRESEFAQRLFAGWTLPWI